MLKIQTKESYLIGRAFRSFTLASILTSVVTQLNTMIDSIVVGNLIGPDAVSAINLAVPVVCVMGGFITLLGSGAIIEAAKAMGEQRYGASNRIFTVSCISMVGWMVVLAALGLVCLPQLTRLLCSDPQIAVYLKEYMVVLIPSFIVYGIFLESNLFISIDGNPQLITKAVLINSGVNILCDIVYIKFFGLGMSGAAYATLTGNVVALLFLSRYMTGKRFSFRFVNPHAAWFSLLKKNIAQGMPLFITNLTLCLLFFSYNSIILHTQGKLGIFVMSICFQLQLFGMMAINGLISTLVAIGGVLLGEKDTRGFRMLVGKCFTVLLSIIGTVTLYTLIAPQTILQLFGFNDPSQMAEAMTSVRIFVLCLLPMYLVLIIKSIHQLLGYISLCMVFTLMPLFVVIPMLWAMARYCPEWVWWSFPVANAVIFVLQLLYTLYLRLRQPTLQPLTLIPAADHHDSLRITVGYDSLNVSQALDTIRRFLDSIGMDNATANNAVLCCEELMMNIVSYANNHPEGHYFDVHLHTAIHRLTIILKDDGRPFNPMFVAPTHAERLLDDEGLNLGLTLVKGLCNDMNYKYMYGQNMLYLNFNR